MKIATAEKATEAEEAAAEQVALTSENNWRKNESKKQCFECRFQLLPKGYQKPENQRHQKHDKGDQPCDQESVGHNLSDKTDRSGNRNLVYLQPPRPLTLSRAQHLHSAHCWSSVLVNCAVPTHSERHTARGTQREAHIERHTLRGTH